MQSILIVVLAACALAAYPAEPKKPVKKTAQSAQKVTLPAGAKQVDSFTHKHTDPQGRKWIYRETPFGLVRLEDKPQEESIAPGELDSVTAAGDGDRIIFERSGPFGKYQWTRARADLTDFEKRVVERQRAGNTAAKSAASVKE